MKKKVIMIGVVLIVCLGTIFYNMQKRDPYKSYNHLKTSEVLKVKEFNRYWVYFYSMDNQESMDSKNGIARLNKAVSNVYFVKIKDKEGIQSYVREQIKQNPDKRNYYNYVIDYISRGHYSIFNIDKSRRIYHVLTSLQRELKQYLNIKYQIDARNSHPVLFIYFIFNYKNISISSSNNIINLILRKHT